MAAQKVHALFLGCESHHVKPVFDRNQRQSFKSDLVQRIRSGSDHILGRQLLLAPAPTGRHSLSGGEGAQPRSELVVWESLSLSKPPLLHKGITYQAYFLHRETQKTFCKWVFP